MRVVLVGSGTGGHFYPLIAIAEALRDKDTERGTDVDLYFMGPDVFNKDALESQRITFVYCPAGKRRLYRSFRNVLDVFKTIYGVFVAFIKLLKLYPDVVMSKGGYTSVPVVFAAWLLRIPVVLHESDAVAGRANILAARFARYIAIAHDEAGKYFPEKKLALVGMPIRKSFFRAVERPHAIIGVPEDRPVIFVTGGSLGALRLNELILQSLDELLPSYTIVHQTGADHEQSVRQSAANLITDTRLLERYFVYGRLTGEQMSAAQSASSVIVSRAGSTSIFEIALKGKPSILIPIPEDVSRDQRNNAYAYAETGAAVVLEEQNLTDDLLVSQITHILGSATVSQDMQTAAQNFARPDAAAKLADTLIAIGAEHES